MLGRAGEEFGLQHVVDDEGMELFFGAGVIAVQLVAGGRSPAIGVDLIVGDFGIQVTEVLPGGEDIVETVLELVAERLLVALVTVDARFAFEEVFGDPPAVALMQGAVGRHATVVAAVGVMLQVGLQRQRGVLAEIDVHRGREGEAFFLVVVELGVGAVRQADQPIGDAFVVIHGAGKVKPMPRWPWVPTVAWIW